MIELPEALTLSKQLDAAVAGRTVEQVLPPTKPHKFCWFDGDPAEYDARLRGSVLTGAKGFGIYVDLTFSNGQTLSLNDGVNPRLVAEADAPRDYQLLLRLSDGTAVAFTVAMYGGIVLHDDAFDNEYYLKSQVAVSPFSPEFEAAYRDVLAHAKPTLSAKALLATEQRFPGVGNGVAQDILFAAGLHPKRKLQTLDDEARHRLRGSLVDVLRRMTDLGGRDTEKDLFGRPGGYATRMSKNTLPVGCPACGGPITKEAYLGGSVYYCPHCQPLVK